jgi:hypothetical protein
MAPVGSSAAGPSVTAAGPSVTTAGPSTSTNPVSAQDSANAAQDALNALNGRIAERRNYAFILERSEATEKARLITGGANPNHIKDLTFKDINLFIKGRSFTYSGPPISLRSDIQIFLIRYKEENPLLFKYSSGTKIKDVVSHLRENRT